MGEYIKHPEVNGEEIKIAVCSGYDKGEWRTFFAKPMLELLKAKGFKDWYGGGFSGADSDTLGELIRHYEEIDTSYIAYSSIEDLLTEYPAYKRLFRESFNQFTVKAMNYLVLRVLLARREESDLIEEEPPLVSATVDQVVHWLMELENQRDTEADVIRVLKEDLEEELQHSRYLAPGKEAFLQEVAGLLGPDPDTHIYYTLVQGALEKIEA